MRQGIAKDFGKRLRLRDSLRPSSNVFREKPQPIDVRRNEQRNRSTYDARRKIQTAGGFTLVEILIAVAIVSLILTVIYGSYASSIDTMNYTREKIEAFSMIRLTLSRMNEELTSSFFSEDGKDVMFSGEEGSLSFISSSHERIFKDSKEYDLSEIGYFTEAAEEGPAGSESLLARRESLCLWRREDRTPDDDVLEGGEKEKLMEGLKDIEFKYYDGEEWRDEWDSKEESCLPQAVKVILKFPEKELSTIAFIPLGKSEEVRSKEERGE